MNNGWVPFDASGWEETVELLQATGKPWPEAAAVYDLRWYIDQGLPLPGRDELQKRWAWKEWRTRQLLATPDRWWDPAKGGTPPSSRGELERRVSVRRRSTLQETSRTPPGRLQETSRYETEQPEQSTNSLQVPSRSPPGPLQESSIARSSAHNAQPQGGERAREREESSPRTTPADEPRGRAAAPDWASGWGGIPAPQVIDLVCAAASAIRCRPVKPTEAAADSIHVAAVQQLDPDRSLAALVGEVELVARWARESTEGQDELGGVRPNGERWSNVDRSRRVSAVLDPRKWPDRLDAARRWRSGADPPTPGGGSRAARDPRRRTEADMSPEELAEGRAALAKLLAMSSPPTPTPQ